MKTKKGIKKTRALVPKKFELVTDVSKNLIDSIVNSFQKGVDFDVVVKGKKPTLLIPGADKLCNQFSLMPVWRKDTETMEMLVGIKNCIAYICELLDRRSGEIVGEGRGASVVGESYNCQTVNATIKMAEIRSKRDAVLNLFPIRDRFTQDLDADGTKNGKKEFIVSNEGKVRTKEVKENVVKF